MTQGQVTFGLDELRAIKKFIELLTKRGAIEMHELAEVGVIYNRLTSFVAAAEAAIEQQKQQEVTNVTNNSSQADSISPVITNTEA